MAKSNGTWKVIATIGGFVIIALGAAVAYGVLSEKVCGMEPNVEKNTEHRIQDEIDTIYIKKEITEIKTMQKQILDEVRR